VKIFLEYPYTAERDRECDAIFEKHGGEFLHHGVFLPTMTRDATYSVPKAGAEVARAALKAAGFEITRKPR
jgi:hypothetical protein